MCPFAKKIVEDFFFAATRIPSLLKQSNTVCGRELMDHGDIQDQVGLFSDVRIPDLEVAAQPVL